MVSANLIVGDDAGTVLTGTSGDDLIYGFDPNGPQGQVTQINATRIADGTTGLFQPLFAGSPPGDYERLFIVQKNGLVKILDLQTQQILSPPFLNVFDEIDTSGERGLLGLEFDPNFAENGFIYVNLIEKDSLNTEIRRYQVSADNPNLIDPASETLIMTIEQPAGSNTHKAGWLEFGPDGYLYVALGDGGLPYDQNGDAQNPDSLLGKMLRIDVSADAFPGDDTRNYSIPADNPFVGVDGADEVWALGLRNPWRNGFDRATGDLYIADVGQNAWEEINWGAAAANYGWDQYEGTLDLTPTHPGEPISIGDLTFPIFEYGDGIDGNANNGFSVTGGYVYRGPSEGLQGYYFFADFIRNEI